MQSAIGIVDEDVFQDEPMGALRVEFFVDAVHNKGENSWSDQEFIKIFYPGGRDVGIFPVQEKHKKEYGRLYRQFKEALASGERAKAIGGQPLSEWPRLSKSQVAEANYHNIFTVEQVAALSDGTLAGLAMGWREIRAAAQAHLKAKDDSRVVEQQAVDITRMEKELESLREELKEAQAVIKQLSAEAKKK